MEMFFNTLLCLLMSLIIFTLHYFFFKSKSTGSLPPGTTGWPLIGETLNFLSAGWKGHPEKFILDRMAKHSSVAFRTHLIGQPATVFCGPAGNKFLYSNESKLVQTWFPKTFDKVFGTSSKEESVKMRKWLPNFLKGEALQRYVGVMDRMTHSHFASEWEGKDRVVVHPLVQNYTFSIACRLLAGVEDLAQFHELYKTFNLIASGLVSVPINLPGTPFNKAIKASSYLKKKLVSIIESRKLELDEGTASVNQDILSHMLLRCDEDGKHMEDSDIAGTIVGLLIGGHDTTTSACTFIVKYLAEYPHVYDAVYTEQMEIVKSKGHDEVLNWEDLQKMKYSWNVACEVMRLVPPFQGGFREALVDFTYNDYFIPKGWKLYWTVSTTHQNPEYFSSPEKFDPSRFEGSGPTPYTFVPFGGGPRICPGREYARVKILIFMHHLIKRFKWKIIIPNERVRVNPMPVPLRGLPIHLYPY